MVTAIKILVKLIKLMIIAFKIEFGPLGGLLEKLEEILRQQEGTTEPATDETTTL